MGIEERKKMRLTNEELAKAITVANQMHRSSPGSSHIETLWEKHLERLLEIEASRAAMSDVLPCRELKPEAYEMLKRHYDACPKCGRKDALLRVTVKWSCEACGWFEDDKGFDAVPAQGGTEGESPNQEDQTQ